jgi:hypothetical protein
MNCLVISVIVNGESFFECIVINSCSFIPSFYNKFEQFAEADSKISIK